MGGQQSTRRITVINDEASGVIKVSELESMLPTSDSDGSVVNLKAL